jgi:hypothetical protein
MRLSRPVHEDNRSKQTEANCYSMLRQLPGDRIPIGVTRKGKTIAEIPLVRGESQARQMRGTRPTEEVVPFSGQSEAGRAFVHDVAGAFKGHACRAEGSFFKKAADECDAVRDAARRIESREGIFRIGSPVAAGLGDFDKTCAEGERRLAGEIGDGEHFIAKGWYQQQVNLIE